MIVIRNEIIWEHTAKMISLVHGKKTRKKTLDTHSIFTFLAHLWGAYAIPVALSVVRRVSSVSTITTRNN